MQEILNTTEELIDVVKHEVKQLVDKVEHIRRCEDVGLKTLARLHGVIVTAKTQLNHVERLRKVKMSVSDLSDYIKSFRLWLTDAYQKVASIMEQDKVDSTVKLVEPPLERAEPWYTPIANWRSMKLPLLIIAVIAMTVVISRTLAWALY